MARLQALEHDRTEYGRMLGRMLFSGANRDFLIEAQSGPRSEGGLLRVRFVIDVRDPLLNRVHWERVVDPVTEDAMAITHGVSVTRSVPGIPSVTLAPVAPRLRTLLVIADPVDAVQEWGVERLHREATSAAIRNALHPLEFAPLEGPVTLDRLERALQEGPDIVYLLAHGVSREDGMEVTVLLEDEEFRGLPVDPSELTRIICGGPKPRLVLLGSCSGGIEHAGSTQMHLPVTVAPLLVRGGVPVVLGMNGPASLPEVTRYFEQFMRALAADADVEAAATAARGRLRAGMEWSVPVVFNMVSDGSLRWPRAAFDTLPPDRFEDWEILKKAVEGQKCVPVVGPVILDDAGDVAGLAQDLAGRHAFPLAVEGRVRRPAVTQFIETTLGRPELIRLLGEAFGKRMQAAADVLGGTINPEAPLPEQATALARVRITADPENPYAALAALNLPLYITTDPFDTLEEALRAPGRSPVSDYPRWRAELPPPESGAAHAWEPDPRTPLVYHLFGRWAEEDSLVVSEDDLLDYLLSASRGSVLPPRIRTAVLTSTLLLAGFPLNDFETQVVFKTLAPRSGRGTAPAGVRHVAALMPPDSSWTSPPGAAKDYLKAYFKQAAVTVCWGSTRDFIDQLRTRIVRGDHGRH